MRGERRVTGTEEIKLIGLRRKIAERMALANSRIPHITVVEEVDVTALEELRAKLNTDRGEKPKAHRSPVHRGDVGQSHAGSPRDERAF